jgi:single-strand DNA-binding protein
MSRSVNRIILVGNAGSEADVRQTASGTTVAHVSLATNRVFNRDGELQKKTDWHRLTFWGKAAEAIEKYLRKGTRLFVEGRVEYGSYDRDGVAVPTTDVIVQDFVFLDPRYTDDAEGAEETTEELEELPV